MRLIKKGHQPPFHGDNAGPRLSPAAFAFCRTSDPAVPEGTASGPVMRRPAWRRGGIREGTERIGVAVAPSPSAEASGLEGRAGTAAGFPTSGDRFTGDWHGNRTHDPKIISLLLYHLS
jgi:hypothetical protein